MSSLPRFFLPAVLALAIIGIATAQAQFQPPTGNPPANNVVPPINVGVDYQKKNGVVGFNKLFLGDSATIPTFTRTTDKIFNTGTSRFNGNINIQFPPCPNPLPVNYPTPCSSMTGTWNPGSANGISSNVGIQGHGITSTRNIYAGTGVAPSTAVGAIVAQSQLRSLGNIYAGANPVPSPATPGTIVAQQYVQTKTSFFSNNLISTGSQEPEPLCADPATGKIIYCPCGSNVGLGIEMSVNKNFLAASDFDPIEITWTSESNRSEPISCSGVTNPNSYGSAWGVPSGNYAEGVHGPANVVPPATFYSPGVSLNLNHIISCNQQSSTPACTYNSSDSDNITTSYEKPAIAGFKDGVNVTLNLVNADEYTILGSFTKARWQGKFSSPNGWQDLPFPMTFTNYTCTTNGTCNNVTQFRLYLEKNGLKKYSNVVTLN